MKKFILSIIMLISLIAGTPFSASCDNLFLNDTLFHTEVIRKFQQKNRQ